LRLPGLASGRARPRTDTARRLEDRNRRPGEVRRRMPRTGAAMLYQPSCPTGRRW
jgi:hypothetical protein